MFAIYKRELKNYFSTQTGYIFMGLFLLICGLLFSIGNIFQLNSNFNMFLGNILFVFLISTPILTMRLLADEKKNNTDQLLLTSPLKVSDIILGKYLAAVTIFLISLSVTIFYAIIIAIYGELNFWETFGAYLGFILIGSSFISIGLFISASTENQSSAAIITFFALVLVWLIDIIQPNVPANGTSGFIFAVLIFSLICLWAYLSTKNIYIPAGLALGGLFIMLLLYLINKNIYNGFISSSFEWISLIKRYKSFSMGILKFDSIIYYISFSVFFIFLSIHSVEKKRWS